VRFVNTAVTMIYSTDREKRRLSCKLKLDGTNKRAAFAKTHSGTRKPRLPRHAQVRVVISSRQAGASGGGGGGTGRSGRAVNTISVPQVRNATFCAIYI
jgi:hypothetical protein